MKIWSVILLLLLCLAGCEAANDSFHGYVEGEYVYIASARAGKLEKLFVSRGNMVKSGTELFELESDAEQYALDQAVHALAEAESRLKDMEKGKRPEELDMAHAQLNQAKAEAHNAALQLQREEKLRKSGGVSQKQLDNTRANAKTSEARVIELTKQIDVFNLPERFELIKAQEALVRAAKAKIKEFKWNLEQKSARAPCESLVYDTLYRVGEWVSAGSPVVQLLPPNNIKIRFFVPETKISTIVLRQKVNVNIDGLKENIPAIITYISPSAEYTPPVIYSNETRSKLVFMVEATPENTTMLHPGQPVNVSIL